MLTDIKPIETEYKGYRFRSRLEARWAVFFDAIGADWEYEPEGYNLPGEQRYLPDFLIHNVKGRIEGDLYIEVKGVLSKSDLRKIETFAGKYCPREGSSWYACDNCPLGSRCEYRESAPVPILIVGNIPEPENYWWWVVDTSYTDNYFFNLYLIDGDWFPAVPCMDSRGGLHIDDGNHNYDDHVEESLTADAYRRARSARFE